MYYIPKNPCCIVIPTLNERENIREILTALMQNNPLSWIVIVDDSSTDGTPAIIKKIQKHDNRIHLIERVGEKSFAKFYIDGFTYALLLGAASIVQMDADGSHDPKDVNKLLQALEEYDFVIGSRYIQGGKIEHWGLLRRFLSLVGNLYTRLILGIQIADFTSGYNAWRAATLRKIDFGNTSCNSYVFQIWLKWKAFCNNAQWKEIPITFTERRHGVSKFHMGIVLESMKEVIKMPMKE